MTARAHKTARRVTVSLNRGEAARLRAMQKAWKRPAAQVMRLALLYYFEKSGLAGGAHG